MDLRPNTKFKEKHLNICSNYGGLGDHLARLTAIRHLKEHYDHVRATVYWHDYFVEIAKILVPESEMLRHKGISAMAYADTSVPLIDFAPREITSLSMNLVDHAFINILQHHPKDEDYVYPKYVSTWDGGIDIDGFGDYIVVTPCFTSNTRKWPAQEINKVLTGINKLGFKSVLLGDYRPKVLGNGSTVNGNIPEGLDLNLASLNLIGQTNLVDCLEIISHARLVVGVDNGLLHLTACTNTPAVWGFTSVEWQHRLPKGVKTETVLPDVSCYGCQSRCFFVSQDFTKCMFEDYLCTTQMKAEKFLHRVKNILDLS
jgi:ADP-heptose:LPS heptosyltransferase